MRRIRKHARVPSSSISNLVPSGIQCNAPLAAERRTSTWEIEDPSKGYSLSIVWPTDKEGGETSRSKEVGSNKSDDILGAFAFVRVERLIG